MKRYIAKLISILPFAFLRGSFYRWIFSYRIENTRIGFGTLILVDQFEVVDSTIGRGCRFQGPMTVDIRESSIGGYNEFICGGWTTSTSKCREEYTRCLRLEHKSMITSHHFFDITGTFILGRESWIAGRGPQFWTHGAGRVDRDVSIGSGSYVGSAARFAPGSSIGSNCIVGIGSVLTKAFNIDNAMVAGVPARVIRRDYDWRSQSTSGEQNV